MAEKSLLKKALSYISPELSFRYGQFQQLRREKRSDVGELRILENIFAVFAPEKAFQRAYFRQGIRDLRTNFSYKAARNGRFRDNWNPGNGRAEVINSPDRAVLRNRARALERDSDLAKAAVESLVRNCVGKGIRPQAATDNEAINDQLEAEFERWCKPKNCDITGHQTFYELQSLFLRRMIYDGEIFGVPVVTNDKKTRIPLKIQTIESDLVDEYLIKASNGNFIVSGVEVDDYSKPLAYWFKQETPDGLSTSPSVRVDAEKIIHLFIKTRANQVRGITFLTQVMDIIHDTDDYLDAELVAARIAACFALAITRQGTGTLGRSGGLKQESSGQKYESLYPGMIMDLQPGENIQAANPARASAGVKDFVEIETRRVAAGTGQSYESVSRDMSKATYSSARQGQLEDRKTWEPVQDFLNNHFNQPFWEVFVTVCVMSGVVNIKDFWVDPEKYFKCEWVAPGWDWVDPLKDVKATGEELNLNLTTLKEQASQRGKDYKTILKQRQKEKELEKSLGLVEITTKGGGEIAQNQ